MPSKPAVEYDEIFKVLANLPIFDAKGKLKKSTDPVWVEAIAALPKMKLISLYLQVYQNRREIQTNLRKVISDEYSIASINQKEGKEKEDIIIEDPLQVDVKLNEDILSIANSTKFASYIQKFVFSPFTVIYCTPEQIYLWNELAGTEKVSLIIIDEVINEASIEKPVLSYMLVSKIANHLFSLYQGISVKRNISSIASFVRSFLRRKVAAPKELFCGFIPTLWDALTKVLNDCSLQEYNSQCYNFLINSTSLPVVLIRTDQIEMLSVVSKWDCLANQWKRKFFLCCLIYLNTLKSFYVFQETVLDMLLLLQSWDETLLVKMSRQRLLRKIEAVDVENNYEHFLKVSAYSSFDKVMFHLSFHSNTPMQRQENNIISKFVSGLKEKASIERSVNMEKQFTNINAYYCPDTLKLFEQLLLDFPVWTQLVNYSGTINVTQMSLDYSSLLKNDSDSKVIDFLKFHWSLINSQCLDMRKYLEKEGRKTNVENIYKYLRFEENWKGKNPIDNISHSDKLGIEDTADDSISCSEVKHLTPQNLPKELFREGSNLIKEKITHQDHNMLMTDHDNSLDSNRIESDVIDFRLQEEISSYANENCNKQILQHEDSFMSDHNYSLDSDRVESIVIDLKSQEKISNDANRGCKEQILQQEDFTNAHNICDMQGKSSVPVDPKSNSKKPSLYCRPFPEANLCYENAHKRKKFRATFQNSCLMNPKKLKNKIFLIENSSMFDALLEIFVFAYRNIRTCQQQCDEIVLRHPKNTTHIMAVIKEFCSKESFTKFYTSRFRILLDIANVDDDNIISCNEPIGTFAVKLLKDNYSLIENSLCENCHTVSIATQVTIIISNSEVQTEFNVIDLKMYLNVYFKLRELHNVCSECENEMTFSREFGPFLIIDIGCFNSLIYVNSVPTELTIDQKQFSLVGLILEKKKLANDDDVTQYIAYCKNLFGFWYEHNSLEKHVHRMLGLPRGIVSILVYVHTL